MHSTEWGRKAGHETSPKTGMRAQLSRGAHLTWTSLRVLALNPRLMILPFFAIFMAAIVGAAFIRLQGDHPTVMDGVNAANASFFQILIWSACAATVGLLLRIAAIRSEAGGKIVSRILGSSWAIATLFVLPTMVVEGIGPLKAFRRSRALLKDRWGAHQKGVLGTGMVFLLLFSVGLLPFLYGILGGAETIAWTVGALLYWLVLSALWSVVHGILVVTLYHYATDSEAAFGFNWQALNHPWIR